MIRIAVLAIVLALTGAPVAGIVCGLNCEGQTSQHHHGAAPCHETSGASLTGFEACDHDVSLAPGVLTAGKLELAPLASQVAATTLAVAAFDTATARPQFLVFPPGASPGVRSSTPLSLRI